MTPGLSSSLSATTPSRRMTVRVSVAASYSTLMGSSLQYFATWLVLHRHDADVLRCNVHDGPNEMAPPAGEGDLALPNLTPRPARARSARAWGRRSSG